MRVLFVEDNADVRELIGLLLQEEGLEVVACATAEAAEVEFGNGGIDFLFTDVSLPAMSGTELARRLLARQPDLWVVFASGYSMQGGLGGWGPRVRSMLKPFEADDLHRMVEEIRAAAAPAA